MKKLDLGTFVKRAKRVHKNTYDYSLSVYHSYHSNIKILCKEHGYFVQTPANHLKGKGCGPCGIKKRALKSRNPYSDFLQKANKRHKNIYSYVEDTYKGSKTKMCIICPIHGDFYQSPERHLLLKYGCPACGGQKSAKQRRYTFAVFVEKSQSIHGKKYKYSQDTFTMITEKTKIFCTECDISFYQTGSKHISGHGCHKCAIKNIADSKLKSTPEFVKNARKVHGHKYDYSLVNYKRGDVVVEIICSKHGQFMQKPFSHLSGVGCQKCTQSRGERAIDVYLTKNRVKFIANKRFKDCRNKNELSFDFHLVDFNACIEFDGEQHYKHGWFSSKEYSKLARTKKNDRIKNRYCKTEGIPLLRIPYTKIKEIPELVSNFINQLQKENEHD